MMDISIHALLAESDAVCAVARSPASRFLSTLSLRRATAQHFSTLHNIFISIHALLAESDGGQRPAGPDRQDFYPRSPCGERRWSVDVPGWILGISIHALLAESDMQRKQPMQMSQAFLSTLSLRRATTHPITILVRVVISIHALLAESDDTLSTRIIGYLGFLSTLSLRRATLVPVSMICLPRDFYPRSPCGERPRTQSQSLFA